MFFRVNIKRVTTLTLVVLLLTSAGWTQSFLVAHVKGKQKWPADEADRLYLSACSIVQSEYGGSRVVRPRITVVLGDDIDQADLDAMVIRLTRWNPYLFAQGVVSIALHNRLPLDERLAMARRAITWADATVEIKAVSK